MRGVMLPGSRPYETKFVSIWTDQSSRDERIEFANDEIGKLRDVADFETVVPKRRIDGKSCQWLFKEGNKAMRMTNPQFDTTTNFNQFQIEGDGNGCIAISRPIAPNFRLKCEFQSTTKSEICGACYFVHFLVHFLVFLGRVGGICITSLTLVIVIFVINCSLVTLLGSNFLLLHWTFGDFRFPRHVQQQGRCLSKAHIHHFQFVQEARSTFAVLVQLKGEFLEQP